MKVHPLLIRTLMMLVNTLPQTKKFITNLEQAVMPHSHNLPKVVKSLGIPRETVHTLVREPRLLLLL